jgi:hypothetical protein
VVPVLRRRLIDDGRGLPSHLAAEVPRGHGVHNERGDRGEHGGRPREWEPPPGPDARQAWRAQRVERRGQDVDQPRGEDHAAGKGLDGAEDVRVRPQRGEPAAQRGHRRAHRAAREDAKDGHDLEPQRARLVPARSILGALALHGDETQQQGDCREKEAERGRELLAHRFAAGARSVCHARAVVLGEDLHPCLLAVSLLSEGYATPPPVTRYGLAALTCFGARETLIVVWTFYSSRLGCRCGNGGINAGTASFPETMHSVAGESCQQSSEAFLNSDRSIGMAVAAGCCSCCLVSNCNHSNPKRPKPRVCLVDGRIAV